MNETINATTYEHDFMADQKAYEYELMLEKADTIVLGYVAAATATGTIPIPFADAPLLITEQVAMMIAINSAFQMDVSKDTLYSLASAAIGIGGTTLIGKTIVSNLLKLIPGVGTVFGGAISATTAGLLTLALGKAYIEVCKAIQMGALSEKSLSQKSGTKLLQTTFREQLKTLK